MLHYEVTVNSRVLNKVVLVTLLVLMRIRIGVYTTLVIK